MRLVRLVVLCSGLAACSAPGPTPLVPEAIDVGTPKRVFVATNRVPEDQGQFGFDRSFNATRMALTVTVPPDRDPGTVSDGKDRPNPNTHFTIAKRDDFADARSFRAALANDLQRTDGQLALFVHGYNNTFTDPSFRIAQMAHDLQLPSTLAAFSWPSRGNPLGYEYDDESIMFSRDMLEDMLLDLVAAGPQDLVLVAHSMGSALLMEALRQIELADPGWTKRNVSGVVLMSPDLDVDVFRAQMRAFGGVPDAFVIFVSERDLVLRFSARLRGDEVRLGNLTDPEPLADLPVQIVDISAFSDRKSGNHFITAGSPALMAVIRGARDLDRGFAQARPSGALILPGTRRVLQSATQIELLPPPR